MDYRKTYDSLVNKARSENRRKGRGQYFESHHIIPSCVGGTDDQQNLVLFTAREHFVAHMLLFKVHPDEPGLAYAAMMMCSRTNSRVYQSLKEAYSKAVSDALKGKSWSEERKNEMFPPEVRKLKSELMKRYKPWKEVSSESRVKQGKSFKSSMSNLTVEERSQKMGRFGEANGRYGKEYVWSDEARAKCSASLKGVPKKKIECPHCGKQCAPNVASRWHFDNCKQKVENVSQ